VITSWLLYTCGGSENLSKFVTFNYKFIQINKRESETKEMSPDKMGPISPDLVILNI